MLKWSPEPFDTPAASPETAVGDAVAFEPVEVAVIGSSAGDATVQQFRSEAGFADTKSLMNSLTQEERSQVYELVEMDLADEYAAREKALEADFTQRLSDLEARHTDDFDRWTSEIAAIMATEAKEAAGAAARLSVQIAGKIVRRAVAAEPEILARVIETTLYKIAESSPLTIQASAADAEWLSGQAGLRERLHIGEVVADRRMESGGCLIKSGGREWDASLARQIGSLTEIVTEMIATAEVSTELTARPSNAAEPESACEVACDDPPEPEVHDVPGLD